MVVAVGCFVSSEQLLDAGHPIINDPLYNHPAWRSSRRSAGGAGTEGDGGSSSSEPYLESVVSEIVQSKFAESAKKTGGDAEREETAKDVGTSSREGTGRTEAARGGGKMSDVDSQEDIKDQQRSSKDIDKIEEEQSEKVEVERSVRSKSLESSKERDVIKDKEGAPMAEEGNSYDPDCTECRLSRPHPSPQELFMCLHALSYKVREWMKPSLQYYTTDSFN